MEESINQEPQFEGLPLTEAKQFQQLLSEALKSYSEKPEEINDETWLKHHLCQELPEHTEKQAEKESGEILRAVQEYDTHLQEIHQAARRGISKERWLAEHIAKASSDLSVLQYGNYLNQIDRALSTANAQMLRTVTTNAGAVSQAYNLDGFIAEQHHVNTFNATAALKKSKFFAEVKVPGPGETYGKNSVDVVIRDLSRPNAPTVHQYQVKYGADAQTTIRLLRDHANVTRYSNQQIVVPAEQVAEVRKAFPGKTVVSCIGGTDTVPFTSTPLTKEQAKSLQSSVQIEGQQPTTDWNGFQTRELAISIAQNAAMAGLLSSAITTGFSLAEQAVNGEKIDTEETVKLALTTGTDSGIKAATAGALKVASEKGILSLLPPGTKDSVFANLACLAIEQIKIFAKVASGELSVIQATDQMGRTTVSSIYSLGWGATGMEIGAAVFSWVPIVGPVVGGLAGGLVGSMAGSSFGHAMYTGIKTVGKGISNILHSGWNKITSCANRIKDWIRI